MPRTAREAAPLTAVDLFAGGGGLTVGLKTAGFKVVAAVEVDPHAFATYKANHPEVAAYKQDIRTVDGKSLTAHAGGRIDLLAGCPPCQGFTSLTSKLRREDPRNALVREMTRLVEATKPRAVMMENVPGLTLKGKRLLTEFVRRLEKLGYQVTFDVLQVADYGTPQNRRRLVLLAGLGFAIPLPAPTHGADGGKRTAPAVRSLRDVITGLPPPRTYSKRESRAGLPASKWHVVRAISADNLERLRHAKPGGSWMDIPEELRPPCHRGGYSGFSNVYGRMSWDEASPTITAGCTNPSKGRFGHPDEDRTISVYEAALLQEFPPDYIIETDQIESACRIIGNALPCGFAQRMAEGVAVALDAHRGQERIDQTRARAAGKTSARNREGGAG